MTETRKNLRWYEGQPITDLNDLLRISTDSYRRNAKAVDTIMEVR